MNVKYLYKSYCRQKLTLSKLRFSKLKNPSSGQFWRSYNSRRLNSNSSTVKLFVTTSKSVVWVQKRVLLFYYFKLEGNYNVLKSKNACFLLKQNINFNKGETESKMENPTCPFRETNLCASTHVRIANWK